MSSYLGQPQIFSRYLDGVPVGNDWIDTVSSNQHLMPAHIEKGAKVVRMIVSDDRRENERILNQVLEGMLKILQKPLIHMQTVTSVTEYRMDVLNLDIDLKSLVQGLHKRSEGRVCLYGPPGTGKTAFGHHLSKVLEKPLVIKKASDLLSMWVGGTEKNIREMFGQANEEKGILLLDEADSFLQDRSNANHSWEVTQVNELLTQMESFEGLFICTTNLMDTLDAASLRRFDMKIMFDYLTQPQAWKMFQSEWGETLSCEQEGILKGRISRMRCLTPGDFATVKRKWRILNRPDSASEFLDQLLAEVDLKEVGNGKGIGFLQNLS